VQNHFKDLNVVGYLDDNMNKYKDIPYPLLTWDQAKSSNAEVILIGSFYWAKDLFKKATSHFQPENIQPPC
jgi:hypothetical protein